MSVKALHERESILEAGLCSIPCLCTLRCIDVSIAFVPVMPVCGSRLLLCMMPGRKCLYCMQMSS